MIFFLVHSAESVQIRLKCAHILDAAVERKMRVKKYWKNCTRLHKVEMQRHFSLRQSSIKTHGESGVDTCKKSKRCSVGIGSNCRKRLETSRPFSLLSFSRLRLCSYDERRWSGFNRLVNSIQMLFFSFSPRRFLLFAFLSNKVTFILALWLINLLSAGLDFYANICCCCRAWVWVIS